MVDIPVQRRRSFPSWVWVVLGVIVLLVALALIDYFVTNIVLGRAPGASPGRADEPFGTTAGTFVLLVSGLLSSVTSRS